MSIFKNFPSKSRLLYKAVGNKFWLRKWFSDIPWKATRTSKDYSHHKNFAPTDVLRFRQPWGGWYFNWNGLSISLSDLFFWSPNFVWVNASHLLAVNKLPMHLMFMKFPVDKFKVSRLLCVLEHISTYAVCTYLRFGNIFPCLHFIWNGQPNSQLQTKGKLFLFS